MFKFEGKELATSIETQTKPVDRLIMANVFLDVTAPPTAHRIIFIFDKLKD